MLQTVRAGMKGCNPGELLSKYVEMRELRRLDASGKLADPRPRMRALAKRFPGSLREIDELTLETIQSRIDALEAVGDEPAQWMIAMARFHEGMREILAIKRVIGKKKITPALRRAAVRAARGSTWDLERVAHPPAGRLTDVVFEHIAKELRITPKRARELVFGKNR
jgi:hypothetical protein